MPEAVEEETPLLAPPDPLGGKPDDWKPHKWICYVNLAAGSTYQTSADRAGVRIGTVKAWIFEWRRIYGQALFRGNRGRGLRAPEDKLYAKKRHQERWKDVRDERALGFGYTSGKAIVLAQRILDRYLQDPDTWVDLTIKDALNLARAADILAGRADDLSDIRPSSLPVAPVASVDLSALERSLKDAGNQETLAAVEVMWARFSTATDRPVPPEIEEVIEATTAEQ